MKSQEAQVQRTRSFEVHAGWGAAVALACIMAGLPLALAFIVAFAAGVFVEMAQWAFPRLGGADVMDAIWTGAGAAAAVGYAWAI